MISVCSTFPYLSIRIHQLSVRLQLPFCRFIRAVILLHVLFSEDNIWLIEDYGFGGTASKFAYSLTVRLQYGLVRTMRNYTLVQTMLFVVCIPNIIGQGL